MLSDDEKVVVVVVAAKVLYGTNAVADEVMLNNKAQALISPNCGRLIVLVSFGSSSTLCRFYFVREGWTCIWDLNLIYTFPSRTV